MDETVRQSYRAYMLRLRRIDGTHPAWRASLQEVLTGERYAFASLDEAVAWLREQIGEVPEGPGAKHGTEAGHNATTGAMAAEGGDDGLRAAIDPQSN